MLGVILLYVGIVLILNGIYGLGKVNDKSIVVMNLFTGGLSLILNIAAIIWGTISHQPDLFYATATGLLFAFTYLFVAINKMFNLDGNLYGWYSLFVAINSIPAGILCFTNFHFSGNYWFGLIWWAWGVLWLTGWIECSLHKSLGKFPAWLGVIEGIVTAWIPGFMILCQVWPAHGWGF